MKKYNVKLSVRLILRLFVSVAIISVFALGATMMVAEKKIRSTQSKLSETAIIESNNSQLITALNETISRELAISSAHELKDLSSITQNKSIRDRLDQSLTDLLDSAADIPEITNELLQLKPRIDELVKIDKSFEDKTRQLFQIESKIGALNLQ